MGRWFLSYNSVDFAMAERLASAIESRDRNARVFLALKSLRAGGYWQQALAEEIATSNAFILLVGQGGIGPWQVTEYYEAHDRSVKDRAFPILLVLLDGQMAPGLPFIRQFNWIITADPTSEKDLGRLMTAAAGAASPPAEPWRHVSPYRGLAAMTEADSDFFFGRERETVEVLNTLAAAPDRLPILLGNSGVGKSSLAQAGVIAALKRQAWPERAEITSPWPHAFDDARRWCFLKLMPGTEPLRALIEAFLDTWQFASTDAERAKQRNGWFDLLSSPTGSLRDLLDATERRYKELGQTPPAAFLLYVDQGEELYVRSEERQRRWFSEVLAKGIGDPRLHGLMSLRADFFGELQKDTPVHKVHHLISVPPLSKTELLSVVTQPAKLLSVRFETDHLAMDIANRAAEESTRDAGALPLLSYLLDDMWRRMVERGDGVLRLPAQSIELGRVLVDRANTFIATHPNSEDMLRRILTLKLATVREDGEPTRRRAGRSEFSDDEWRLVSELADHPNRLLVTVTADADAQAGKPDPNGIPASRETYAEVAHEAIFRRWDRLREWIAAEREFLAWKTGLEGARRAWKATPDNSKQDALLMGLALSQARSWRGKRSEDIAAIDREFIDQSSARESRAKTRARRVQALVYMLLVGIIVVLIGVMNETYIKEQVTWYRTIRPYRVANVDPYVLTPAAERALKPGDTFRECANDCPEMVVAPAGEFMMGSPADEKSRYTNENSQHRVVIARPFAVSKFEVTFLDWDACMSVGGCPKEGGANDAGWGRGKQPVIYLSWDLAKAYAAWLSSMTGKAYRLLSEAEWEYAARAGTTTAYFWGDEIGKDHTNCRMCGSRWDGRLPAPVGSFAPNAFGLYDMHGNVWEWVEDCYHINYNGAPTDGSAWTSEDCARRVVRGGSWDNNPNDLRSASRVGAGGRSDAVGFRLARMLAR